jgi:hypothetical protein
VGDGPLQVRKELGRQTTAYAEVISSLREFECILDQLYQNEISGRKSPSKLSCAGSQS